LSITIHTLDFLPELAAADRCPYSFCFEFPAKARQIGFELALFFQTYPFSLFRISCLVLWIINNHFIFPLPSLFNWETASIIERSGYNGSEAATSQVL
jgi:hypothetical protein